MRISRAIIYALVAAVVAAGLVVGGWMAHNLLAAEKNQVCSKYGIPLNDSRSHLESIYLDPNNPRYDATVDGVRLGVPFSAQGTSSEFHVFARGIDKTKPVGVVMRLHGDGAEEYKQPAGLTACMAQVANSHNMIFVVPRTPDREGTPTWWESLEGNTNWLASLLNDQLAREYNIDRSNIQWMGYSGGSELLTYGIVPKKPDLVTRGALMVAGGGAPKTPVTATPEQKSSVDLTWVVGEDDNGSDPENSFNALGAARKGEAFYRAQGFENVHSTYPAAFNHVNLPQALILDQKLDGKEISMP